MQYFIPEIMNETKAQFIRNYIRHNILIIKRLKDKSLNLAVTNPKDQIDSSYYHFVSLL